VTGTAVPYDLNRYYEHHDFRISLGLKYLVQMVEGMGVTSKVEAVQSFPLGTNDVTAAEVAKIYQTFIEGKVYRFYEKGPANQINFIRRIEDRHGSVVFEPKRQEAVVALPEYGPQMHEILKRVVTHGTGRTAQRELYLQMGDVEAAGNDPAKPTHHLSFAQGIYQGMMAQGLGQHAPGFGPALGFQDQVIAAMKYLVSGSAPTLGIDNFDRKGPKGIEIGLIEAFHLGNFKGFKLDVKNAGDVSMDIQEKDFYRSGDLAFYVENRVLNPKTSTIMYVVTRG
jgi:hypothetical protein